MDMQKTGIYKIYFKSSPNRVYIGSTSFNRKNINSIKTGFYQRRYNHFNLLLKNKHGNLFLQRTFNKYGANDFVFEIIEVCDENIIEREQYWINYYQSYNNTKGYNLLKQAGSSIGFKKTEEHIKNHRNSLLKYYENNTIHNKVITSDLISLIKVSIDEGLHYKLICDKFKIKKSTFYNIKSMLNKQITE